VRELGRAWAELIGNLAPLGARRRGVVLGEGGGDETPTAMITAAETMRPCWRTLT
jgi:hypothetical protein